MEAKEQKRSDFLREIISKDLADGKHEGWVITRFPPEPNGYLHFGHAKSICLNFGIAEDFEPKARCHVRFDDTNPLTEKVEYVESIKNDIKWLGFEWGEHLYFASDYFGRLYELAEQLIMDGKAYVDSLSEEEIREYRGTVTEAGKNSPHRDRSVEENLDLFRRMKAGEFEDGAHVLRAKIDMASNNMKMRDPLLYRIKKAEHYRTGSDWCIYPFYDYTHCLSDAFENITHSLCTLEFDNNRELYDWVIEHTRVETTPRQHEFARGNVEYMITSKRKLLKLVDGGYVKGWDDPRMPTLAGMRRRGITPEAIRAFWGKVGVAKTENRIDIALLEHFTRDDLNTRAPRRMAVLDPLKVTITNGPDDVERLETASFPAEFGKEESRPLHFSSTVYIEANDFKEDPPKGYKRLRPDGYVRLQHGYIIHCDDVVKDDAGKVIELKCTYFPESKSGQDTSGLKVKSAINWVSAEHSIEAEVRLYDRLFAVPDPGSERDFLEDLNPESEVVVSAARLETSLASARHGDRFQFVRHGYFMVDEDSEPGSLVFNRTVTLKDTWAKKGKEKGKRKEKGKGDGVALAGEAVNPRDAIREADGVLGSRYGRYRDELGVAQDHADVLTGDREIGDFFESAISAYNSPASVGVWTVTEVKRVADGDYGGLRFGPAALAGLVRLIDEGAISQRAGRDVFEVLARDGGDPAAIVADLGLAQNSDRDALAEVVGKVIAANPDEASRFKAGKKALMGFFVGQVMKETRGTGNPALVNELVNEALID